MNKQITQLIKKLTDVDTKSLSQKALKTCEEVGELAKVVLPFESAAGTTHRFVDKEKVLEEVADVLLCIKSIAYELGFDDDDLDDMVSHKIKKWSELLNREIKAKYPVPFEFHVTVCTNELDRFKNVCHEIGVKPIVLDLQNELGSTVMHDVMTSSTIIGNNKEAYSELKRISQALKEQNFEIVREKIETVPWHPSAPSKEHANPKMPEDCYFEAHIGIVCNEKRRKALQYLAQELDCHMSRNIFKKLDKENYKIMLTYREYYGFYERFQEKVNSIAQKLESRKFEYDKIITEFSIYDTKISHDSDWLIRK